MYSHGAPVTINVYNGTAASPTSAEVNRTPNIISSQAHVAPPLPPARISAPAQPGANAVVRTVHTPATAPTNAPAAQPTTSGPDTAAADTPPAPSTQDENTLVPALPQDESVPGSPAGFTNAVLPFEACTSLRRSHIYDLC